MMKVTCIGGAGTVTGSSYLIEGKGIKFLVDCGMFQGSRHLEELNYRDFPYDPSTVSHLFLTHAHIDHCGLIPKLVKDGFSGEILCTPATLDLCEIMLTDSAHIQEMESEWYNRKRRRAGRQRRIEPLYTRDSVNEAMEYFKVIDYDREVEISNKLRARFKDAGHILGSAICELWIKEDERELKLVFSGDLGSMDQPIIRDPSCIKEADWVFIESTYGNRLHKSKEETYRELRDVIISAKKEGGNVLIPAFAVERTQEILYVLHELYKNGEIPYMDLYLDSPLAISATEIFLRHPECFDQEIIEKLRKGDHPLEFPGMHYVRTTEESIRLNQIQKGAIIIAASGMGHAGRIKHHLRHNIWRPETHVVFVGFQAQGTTGRLIVDGAKRVKIMGEEVAVNAKIHTIGGFSAHADRDGLLKWLQMFDPKPIAVIIVHGEMEISRAFSIFVKEKLSLDTIVPNLGEVIDLDLKGGKVKKGEIFIQPLRFDSEMEISWRMLEEIINRFGDIDDISDLQVRESLVPKLREINIKLDEVRQYLAGKELWQ
jgi:metallo-beta-lactamase family protein